MSVVLKAALQQLRREAISTNFQTARYKDILERAFQATIPLKDATKSGGSSAGRTTLCKRLDCKKKGLRIAFMAPPGREYVEATLASWLIGGIAVPLCISHPQEELKYVLEDSQASVVLSSPDYTDRIGSLAHSLGIHHQPLGEQGENMEEEEVAERLQHANSAADEGDGSLIIYTSGTTGRPKGALHSHGSINAQISGLCSSWEWQKEDRILHCLPLHHIHGIVNALFCPLAVGAAVEFLPKFSPSEVWTHLMREENPISVFMGVPTMYNYLLSKLKEMESEDKEKAKKAAARLRLTVSGSAACPVPIMNQWEEISGQRLLERYGMTETGMLLSNKYRGERKPGFVGYPLPGVSATLRDDGELAVKGDVLFKEYWNKPEATAESFDQDGYFLTGDTATTEGEDKCWKILGRTSTDIIKSGGYKISALQIEDALLENPKISNCAVLGTADDALGESITAVISCDGDKVDEEEVKEFGKRHLPKYQVPHRVIVLDEIPRNPMGKINKKALKRELDL